MSRAARSQPRGPRAAMATPFTPMVPSPYVVTPVARVDPSDRYELVKRLAVGGMAEIWLAKMRGIEGFERQVVVKSMLPHLAEEDQYVKMFLEEARLGATLHHQNIAQVFDIGGSAERGYFFAMEYLDGVDLRAIVQHGRGPLPLEHALWVAMGVAAGLHYAHERVDATGKPMGIIHRDVSLSNVFVTRDGAVKLLDFGIARQLVDPDAPAVDLPVASDGSGSGLPPSTKLQCAGVPAGAASRLLAATASTESCAQPRPRPNGWLPTANLQSTGAAKPAVPASLPSIHAWPSA